MRRVHRLMIEHYLALYPVQPVVCAMPFRQYYSPIPRASSRTRTVILGVLASLPVTELGLCAAILLALMMGG